MMKFNILSYTLFLFVMIMFFPSLIFAWTVNNPPIRPAIVLLKDCARWIEYNGFSLEDYPSNRVKAFNRDHSLDKKASTWAAMYAFKIGGKEDLFKMLPKDFCKTFGRENRVPKAFRALDEESRYCEDWITLYGFSEDDQKYNSEYALNIRDERVRPIAFTFKTSFMALWAYLYYKSVKDYGKRIHMPPKHFCKKLGKNVEDNKRLMPFMCKNDTYLTCSDWIYLFDFNNDNDHNLDKAFALNTASAQYPIQIHGFPSEYSIKLMHLLYPSGILTEQSIHFTPKEFCKTYDGDGDTPREYNYEMMEKVSPS